MKSQVNCSQAYLSIERLFFFFFLRILSIFNTYMGRKNSQKNYVCIKIDLSNRLFYNYFVNFCCVKILNVIHLETYFFGVSRQVLITIHTKFYYFVCVWIWMKIVNYFTIQLIFAIIHGFHCTFRYYSWAPVYYFNLLLLLFTVLSVISFQFQQNKWYPNRPFMLIIYH